MALSFFCFGVQINPLLFDRPLIPIHTTTMHQPTRQEVYASQIDIIRPVVLKQDPTGLFRTKLLSDVFRLPF
jgi:hypothetical protein